MVPIISTDETKEDQQVTSDQQDTFESFLQNNIDSIEVPELNEITETKVEKRSQVEILSEFFENVLNNDFENFETMVSSSISEHAPFLQFAKNVHVSLCKTSGFDMLLPGISAEEISSISYISTLYYKIQIRNYIYNSIDIPSVGIPVLKYDGTKCASSLNFEFASDLLLLVFYLKLARDRLQQKDQDPYTNKTYLYFSSRIVCDPLIFRQF